MDFFRETRDRGADGGMAKPQTEGKRNIALCVFAAAAAVIFMLLPGDKTMDNPVQRGLLDVSRFSLGIVPLAGDWERIEDTSYPDAAAVRGSFARLPSSWDHAFGFASYRLKVRGLDPSKRYALKLFYIKTSARLGVDGEVLFQAGVPGKSKASYRPAYGAGVAVLPPGARSSEILLEVANFEHRFGGAFHVILLGRESDIRSFETWSLFSDGATICLCLIMGGICLLNAIMRKKNNSLLFGLCYLVGGWSIFLASAESLPFRLFPSLDWVAFERLSYAFEPVLPLFILLAVQMLFGGLSRRRLFLFLGPAAFIFALAALAPVYYFTAASPFIQGYGLFLLFVALALCWNGVRRRYPYAWGLSLVFLVFGCIIFSAFLYSNGRIAYGQFLPLSFLSSVLRLSFLSRQIFVGISYVLLFAGVTASSLVFVLETDRREGLVVAAVSGGGIEAIRAKAMADGLSPREIEVTLLVLEGKQNKDICDGLCISLSTVKTHLSHIFQKTGTRTRSELFFHFYL
jgi:DNA-binding CsgD family transcriptional regulator